MTDPAPAPLGPDEVSIDDPPRTDSAEAPRKVAVLGGGVGALSAVWELTGEPDWQDRYDITVYQLGWRLGGQGASSRNHQQHERIEEHGLHVLLGYYHNFFAMLRQAYTELDRPPDAPLATLDDALEPRDWTTLMERVVDADGEVEWKQWTLRLPKQPGEPGDGVHSDRAVFAEPWSLLVRMMPAVVAQAEQLPFFDEALVAAPGGALARLQRRGADLWQQAGWWVRSLVARLRGQPQPPRPPLAAPHRPGAPHGRGRREDRRQPRCRLRRRLGPLPRRPAAAGRARRAPRPAVGPGRAPGR